ncbi:MULTISPECIES: sigma 54-interacting transcriptional regulator [unclassified Neptuniibacter]|jgi:two-component system response regulator GlrR|uniref:sigma 54-interacting transcriptional regulator n=1 Tax=unclassified Neptuniibacter TaxID=2630693 RepID=UPI0026E16970|nr:MULTISPECIES: sigma 54-interacting transcriptional regulator [unclassified Neptuniibacter]MDO6514219.1 sigma 54-interacting transcriptional regulator [Neptuniibacter sp. 2_MG-2023]MDO6592658.1 sigma 54-interacting transcriptional regulator [Neptuniibacter sp. 1_MG-2023]
MKPHILLVDDDASLLKLLSMRLEASGYQISCAESAEAALEVLNDKIDLLVTDLRMEGMDGLALFKQVQRAYPQLPVVIITAHGSIPEAVTATQQGVFGFLTKPIDRDQLMQNIEAALASTSRSEGEWRNNIISRSHTMEQLLQEAEQIAASDVSVLITGASGSGKELLANAIHKASPRSKKPFIAINCGALPEQLLESELFGHSKGAFTGAVNKHEGLFQAANGGTLFLDEIGDMPTPLQVKLLRVLQERQIRPVGSTETIAVDVRVISATHRDLEQAMQDNSFREDLFYRLNVVNLHLPPLKDRPEDILPLARYFVEQAALRHNPKVKNISSAALQVLAQASWPGNVRQLENIIEKVTALSTTPIISDTAIHRALANQEQVIANFNDARAEFEKRYLCKVLQITEGNVTQAAKIAGRNRTDFYKLLKKHALEAADYKNGD